MNREEAREYIISNAKSILTPDKSGKGFVCPICGSGDGAKGTGITTKDGIHFTCWAGCFKHSDIIDIIGQRDGLTEYREKLEAACREMGVTLEGGVSSYRRTTAQEDFSEAGENQNPHKTERNTHSDIHTRAYTQAQPSTPEEADYTAYFQQCHSRLSETDYPQKRGLSSATLERFNIGFDPAWKHPKVVAQGKNPPATPRLIIPTSSASYLARDTRAEIPEPQRQYSKSKVGKVHIFNLEALEDAERPCFVVEGEIDALSIIEVGGNALALGSTSNADTLLRALEGRTLKQPLIIALDNDEAGEKAAKRLCDGLEKQGLIFYRRNPCEGFKDANEALQKEPDSLRAAVEAAKDAGEEEKKAYLQTSSAANLQSFIDGIAASVDTPCISTGFPAFDLMLDGGLYEGLYIMGAISSLGKTSLALQICDQIAAAGTDVLIFSLEMARAELMAKSISRHTFILSHEAYPSPKDADKANRNAKTGRGITDGKRYINYSREERQLINSAVTAYSQYAGRIFINEGVGDIDVEQIRETIERHIRFTGRKPLVLVDYLQIVAPYSERATDKQNTDKAVLELKRISRDFKTTVIAISSLNRMSYKDAISMEAFKESGAIEYSADVLLGLQLKGAGKKDFDATAEKKKNPRTIELVILKNRNGAVGERATFAYYPLFNFFEEE